MTTAHRATHTTLRGLGSNAETQHGYYTAGVQSTRRHGRDQPGYLTLKYRAAVGVAGAGSEEQADSSRADAFRRELEARERAHFEAAMKKRGASGGSNGSGGGSVPALQYTDKRGAQGDTTSDSASVAGSMAGSVAGSRAGVAAAPAPAAGNVDAVLAAFDDADDEAPAASSSPARRGGVGAAREPGEVDADEEGEAERSEDEYDDEDEEDEEDDMEELMRELERIKKEREEERQRKAREAAEVAAAEERAHAISSNPLTAAMLTGGAAPPALRRRFGDDTVFSNTHANEPEVRKRFINDMIRSDFHRNFLRKFIV